MTDAPKTRLQQLVDKSADESAVLTDADRLLDSQAGFYNELIDAKDANEARQILVGVNLALKEDNKDLKTYFVQPVLAATLNLATRYADAAKTKPEDAGDVLEKLGAVLGVKPQLYTGVKVEDLAVIMERDLDLPAFEAEIKRFGFDVKDGAIGAWNGTKPAAPKPSANPPRLG